MGPDMIVKSPLVPIMDVEWPLDPSMDVSSPIDPTLILLRGGTYTFTVNQASQFWIQGETGVTGFSRTQPNVQTRQVYGVTNNGAEQGVVTFTVPSKDALNQYIFPGNTNI